MDQLKFLIDLFLHLNEHLANIINQYGTWTYAFLFFVIFLISEEKRKNTFNEDLCSKKSALSNGILEVIFTSRFYTKI